MIQVRQNGGSGCTGGQLRTFTYDSLSRLRVAANPESGQIVYTYDDNGNLKTRSDDRGVVVTKYYDALNRLTSNEYSDGTPLVLFDYETTAAPQIGRLKKVYTVDIGDRRYTYDALGRITNSTQITGGQTYSFTYAYNLDDSVASITYPSSRVVAYDYDAAGRVLKAGLGTAASADYVSAAVYAAHGAASSMTLGNTLVETTGFNGRLQPTSIQAGSLLTLTFGYGTTNNNGNVRSQTIAGTGIPTFAQTYTYDGVNRLWTMSEASPSSLSRTYAYDAYGNRAVTGSQVGVGTPTSTGAFSASTNRMTSPAWADYDAAGNQLTARVSGVQWSAAYDAENKQNYFCAGLIVTCTATNANAAYVYDGEGNRVQKMTTGETTTYVYDAFGRLAAEYSTSGAGETPGRYFRTTDHLGSTRLVTNGSMGVVSRRDFFPFGEQILAQSSSGRQGISEYNAGMGFPQLFTAKERDEESGLDYFGARYHSAALGRFTGPDPLDWLSWQNGNRESRQRFEAFISDPQGFNKYVYTRNNPLTFVDPDGEDFEVAVHFEGDASDEEKERILSALRQYLTNLDIGNVVVRDAAVKSDDRRTWGQWVKDGFNVDFQSITVDFSRASYADASEYVFAGDMTGGGELANLRDSDPRQWSNVVAWRVLHETISHELKIGPDTDQLFGIDPSRKGTLIEGAYGIGRPGIPGLNPRDTKTLQDLLRPRVRQYVK